jgi:hypothetical protein
MARPSNELPSYGAPDANDDRWVRCLASAEDYFSRESLEYRLLERGIALHHGKMPGLLARRLKRLIDAGLVRVVIATSTLSEGVNIPVNYLLVPSVHRGTSRFSVQEFTNLIGRAGRPGVAAEGHALVMLQEREPRRGRARPPPQDRQRQGYEELAVEIEQTTSAAGQGAPEDAASSALVKLIQALQEAWRSLTGGGSDQQFQQWLEQVAVASDADDTPSALRYVDSLDAFLIAAVQEIEELRGSELAPPEIEAELIRVWRHTYAFAAAQDERRLMSIWLARGRVIKEHYPNAVERRQIYKTSLAPSSASTLLQLVEEIRAKLVEGSGYATAPTEQRFTFITEVLSLLSRVRSFRIGTQMGRARSFRDWENVLRWWLAKATLMEHPNASQITNWYDFVSTNFIYRSVWGVGSILGILLESASVEAPIRALEMDDWPRSGLPWIAFWLKELITWGTLEPVAAFLLARGDAMGRSEAERSAVAYYAQLPNNLDANDQLDPRRIRDWVEANRPRRVAQREIRQLNLGVQLEREPAEYSQEQLVVAPIERNDRLDWIDPAGYVVANGDRPQNWPPVPSEYLFELHVSRSEVVGEQYLSNR